MLLLLVAGFARFWSEIRPDDTPNVLLITGWMAMMLFIPAGYLYLRDYTSNNSNDGQLAKRDLIHFLPIVIFCIGCTVAWLINNNVNFLNGNVSGQSLTVQITLLCFKLFVYIVAGVYLLLLLSMLKKSYLKNSNRNEKEYMKIINNGYKVNGDHEKKNGEAHSIFLSEEKMINIDGAVKEFLSEKKPFLKHGYSLKELSDDINVPLHHLSAFINRYYKMNFNDFINEYRVNHCKVKIINDEWKSKKLEAIAEESGFSNRNTFTSAFKKATGLNPSGFLKKIKEEQKHCEPIYIDMDAILNGKKVENFQ
jgi:AraC-like DNA-binding protein